MAGLRGPNAEHSPSSPVDRLVDLVVFAPLGLALRARDEVPKLAAHGRDRFTSQARLARMVGQMAVAQGRRKVETTLARLPGVPGAPTPEPSPGPPTASGPAPGSAEPRGRPVPIRDLGPDDPDPTAAPASGTQPPPRSATEPGPAVADLPIPGYDSLSASQVVQRLAGLSGEELEAVRAYELAGRNRQTVLLRVAQLRAAS